MQPGEQFYFRKQATPRNAWHTVSSVSAFAVYALCGASRKVRFIGTTQHGDQSTRRPQAYFSTTPARDEPRCKRCQKIEKQTGRDQAVLVAAKDKEETSHDTTTD